MHIILLSTYASPDHKFSLNTQYDCYFPNDCQVQALLYSYKYKLSEIHIQYEISF